MPSGFMERLNKAGFSCDYMPEITRNEVVDILPLYLGIIVRSKLKVDKDLMDVGTHLKFIGRAGAGMDNIDEEYAQQKGINCFNAPEGNRDAVGEHAVGMLLSLMHKIVRSDREIHRGIWDREANRGVELMGKTVGIVGYGNMGESFAKRLLGFGVYIIAYDKYRSGFSNEQVNQVTLEELFKETDILSLHIPLTNETKYLVDKEFLNQFRKNIYLINTARGEVINTQALLHQLKEGKVLGAALDVLENERIESLDVVQRSTFNELIGLQQVVLTSHVAGWSFESYERIGTALADKITAFF